MNFATTPRCVFGMKWVKFKHCSFQPFLRVQQQTKQKSVQKLKSYGLFGDAVVLTARTHLKAQATRIFYLILGSKAGRKTLTNVNVCLPLRLVQCVNRNGAVEVFYFNYFRVERAFISRGRLLSSVQNHLVLDEIMKTSIWENLHIPVSV